MRTAAAIVPVLALVWLGFQPALDAGVLNFDDDKVLTLNPRFRGLGAEQLGWMFSTPHVGHYQPLTWISYALDWSPDDGIVPVAFHRTNVILHGLAAVTFLLLARLLLRRALPAAGPTSITLAAAGAAALFAVHPLRAESVAWITERRDVLSAPLFFLCLYAWVRWAGERPRLLETRAAFAAAFFAVLAVSLFGVFVERDVPGAALSAGPGVGLAVLALVLAAVPLLRSGPGAGWYALALLAMFLSLFAKAWGIVLPAVLLVLDGYPLRRLRSRRDVLPLLVEKLPFAALTVAFASIASWAQASQGGTMKTLVEHSVIERVLQACYGLAWYPFKTLIPRGLSPIYELPDELGAGDPRFLVPTLVVLAVTAVLLLRRRRWPALAAAWIAYAAIVSPVLGVAQSGPQLVADRYSYLSCTPFPLLLAGGWLMLGARAVPAAALLLAIAGSTWMTRAQVACWNSDETLWERAYAVDRTSYHAHLQLAGVRLEQGRLDEARALLERGFELEDDPHFPAALGRYWELRAVAEPELAAEHRAQALESYRQAYVLALETDRFVPFYRLSYGTSLWNVGRHEEALGHLTWYAENQPDSVDGRHALGAALLALGRPQQALAHLEAATSLDPLNSTAWRSLAAACEALGQRPRAEAAWRSVLQLLPADAEAGVALARLGAGH